MAGLVLAGRVLSGLAVTFLMVDGVMKLFKPAPVVQAMTELGFPDQWTVGVGVTLVVCTLLHVYPRTSLLGAVLLTGYLGGAVAIHVRAQSGLFAMLFPVMVGAMVWGGLWLRDERARVVLPI